MPVRSNSALPSAAMLQDTRNASQITSRIHNGQKRLPLKRMNLRRKTGVASNTLQPSGTPFRGMHCRPCRWGVLLLAMSASEPLIAQPLDCDAYARAYADAHRSGDPTDLYIVDRATQGAVAGGAWRGERGARRGAVAGGALGVLDTLGNNPAGWRGLYDIAYRLCRNNQSSVIHRPSTLGDPSHRPARPHLHAPEPAMPPLPAAPRRPNN